MIFAETRGESIAPFSYGQPGQFVDLGKSSVLIDDFLGALVWREIYFREFGHNLDRAQVLLDWATSIFVRPDISRIFEE